MLITLYNNCSPHLKSAGRFFCGVSKIRTPEGVRTANERICDSCSKLLLAYNLIDKVAVLVGELKAERTVIENYSGVRHDGELSDNISVRKHSVIIYFLKLIAEFGLHLEYIAVNKNILNSVLAVSCDRLRLSVLVFFERKDIFSAGKASDHQLSKSVDLFSAIGLVGHQVEYFEAMVQFGNAKTDELKKKFLEQMCSIAFDHKVRVVDKDAFEYYDSWKNPVVRELAPLMPGAMPGEIAKMCTQEISALEVRKSLAFLERAGFLKQVGENIYVQTEKSVEGSKEGLPLAIRSMHREMGNLAVDSLDRFTANERNVTGVTMGVDRETYEQIVHELDECRKKITALAEKCDNIRQVYRLNLQLFPLSKDVGKHEEA